MLEPKVTMRPLADADIAAVRDLHARSFAALAGSHHTPAQIDAHVAYIHGPGYPNALRANNLMVARGVGPRILGTAGWCAAESPPDTARIRKVFVSPDAAGRGLGRLLVTTVEAAARAFGYREFFVRANANAVGFYKRLGYRPHENGVMEVAGATLPVVFMRKRETD